MQMADFAAPPTLGDRLEGEWIPGHWHPGSICDVDARGRLTIRYDDGYIQSGVELARVRPCTSGVAAPGAAGLASSADHALREEARSWNVLVRALTQDARVDCSALPLAAAAQLAGEPLEGRCKMLRNVGAIGLDCPVAYLEEVDSDFDGSWCQEPSTPDAWSCACTATSVASFCGSRQDGTGVRPVGHQKLAAFRDGAGSETKELLATEGRCASRGGAELAELRRTMAAAEACEDPAVARVLHDQLLAVEAQEFRQRADQLVDEAVASDDWWRLQAAMQLVVGAGLAAEKASQLTAAMRAQRARLVRQAAQQRGEEEGEDEGERWVPWVWESAESLEVERSGSAAALDDVAGGEEYLSGVRKPQLVSVCMDSPRCNVFRSCQGCLLPVKV